jgi:TPR repeat protein
MVLHCLKLLVPVCLTITALWCGEEDDDVRKRRHQWIERAIGGDLEAMVQLGDLFLYEGDDVLAKKWLNKAVENGVHSALWKLVSIEEHRPLKERAEDMSKLYRQLIQIGDTGGYYRLGRLLAWPDSPLKDHSLADLYLADASDLHVVEAQVLLGRLFMGEWGHRLDHMQAIYHFQRAAKTDSAEAHRNLGLIYRYGIGTRRDLEKAWIHYATSARLGDSDAMYAIAEALYSGEDITKDLARSQTYYRKAAKLGHSQAISRLKRLEF